MALLGGRQGSPGGAKLRWSVFELRGCPEEGLAGLQLRERGGAEAVADAFDRGDRPRRLGTCVPYDEGIPIARRNGLLGDGFGDYGPLLIHVTWKLVPFVESVEGCAFMAPELVTMVIC